MKIILTNEAFVQFPLLVSLKRSSLEKAYLQNKHADTASEARWLFVMSS